VARGHETFRACGEAALSAEEKSRNDIVVTRSRDPVIRQGESIMGNLIDILYREYWAVAGDAQDNLGSLSPVKREQSVAASICGSAGLSTCGEPKSGIIWSGP
jgi:hypothetical protein